PRRARGRAGSGERRPASLPGGVSVWHVACDRLAGTDGEALARRDRGEPDCLVAANRPISAPPECGSTGIRGRLGTGGRTGESRGTPPGSGRLVGPRPAFADDLVPGPASPADHPQGSLEDPRRATAL